MAANNKYLMRRLRYGGNEAAIAATEQLLLHFHPPGSRNWGGAATATVTYNDGLFGDGIRYDGDYTATGRMFFTEENIWNNNTGDPVEDPFLTVDDDGFAVVIRPGLYMINQYLYVNRPAEATDTFVESDKYVFSLTTSETDGARAVDQIAKSLQGIVPGDEFIPVMTGDQMLVVTSPLTRLISMPGLQFLTGPNEFSLTYNFDLKPMLVQ